MELWDVYDINRNRIGKLHERGRRLRPGEYHLVADIWTITSKGQILLTQRHPNKHLGLMWECTGGAVVAGESSLEGAVRELKEEVGINILAEDLKLISTHQSKECFLDTYLNRQEIELKDIKLQEEEVIAAKLVSYKELESMHRAGMVVPSVWERFKEYECQLLEGIVEQES
ncbi:MAG: NUDIX domain-containing protein [Cellulosilyticum sp.]|nr:NUDIX domain-containing protein [Cellulosilyticum sp.]